MKYLIFDIETAPNGETSWKPPEEKPEAFPPIPEHKVVSISGMLLSLATENASDVQNRIMWFGTYGDPGDERSMILEFLEMFYEQRPNLVSYNGRGFDIPVILHRCMRYGIQCPEFFDRDFRYRFSMGGHIDLQDQLSDYGASMRSKLGYICQALGMPGKMDVSGGDVAQLHADGKQDVIDSYCMCDVAETAWLFIRFMHLMGQITDVTNHNAIHAIKSAMMGQNNEMLDKMIEETNLHRLSLEEQNDEVTRKPATPDLFEGEPIEGGDAESDPDLPF